LWALYEERHTACHCPELGADLSGGLGATRAGSPARTSGASRSWSGQAAIARSSRTDWPDHLRVRRAERAHATFLVVRGRGRHPVRAVRASFRTRRGRAGERERRGEAFGAANPLGRGAASATRRHTGCASSSGRARAMTVRVRDAALAAVSKAALAVALERGPWSCCGRGAPGVQAAGGSHLSVS
jgi:hypothetical protein